MLDQRYGSIRAADEPIGRLPVEEVPLDLVVFRSTHCDRLIIGCQKLRYETPGGELWIELQGLVNEGEVLEAR